MRDPDETLAAIDDVITWHGGDAMVWTAEEPERPDFSDIASGLAAFTEALRPAPETVLAMRSAMFRLAGVHPPVDPLAQMRVIN